MSNFTVGSGTLGRAALTAGRLPEDVNPEFYKLMANIRPLLTLTEELGKEKVWATQKEHFFQDDDIIPYEDKINNVAGYSDVATDLVVDHDEYFLADAVTGDVAYNKRTEEYMLVTSTTPGSSLITVTRGYYSSSAAAILDNDELFIIRRGSGDLQQVGNGVYTQPGRASNYVEDIDLPFKLSRDALNAKKYQNVDEKTRIRAEKLEEMEIQKELKFLIGKKTYTNVGGATGARYEMGGIISYLAAANIFTFTHSGVAATDLSQVFFHQKINDLFVNKGNREKYALCGWKAVMWFEYLKKGDLILKPDDKVYSLLVDTYQAADIRLKILPHHLLTGQWADHMLIIDPQYLRVIGDKEFGADKLWKETQAPRDIHSYEEIYEALVSLEVPLPEVHCLLKGVYPPGIQ